MKFIVPTCSIRKISFFFFGDFFLFLFHPIDKLIAKYKAHKLEKYYRKIGVKYRVGNYVLTHLSNTEFRIVKIYVYEPNGIFYHVVPVKNVPETYLIGDTWTISQWGIYKKLPQRHLQEMSDRELSDFIYHDLKYAGIIT